MGRTLRALAASLPCALALGAAPSPRPPDTMPFVLTRMTLDLRVDYERGTVSGTVALTVRNVSREPVATVPLLLGRLFTVAGVARDAGPGLPFAQRVALFEDDSSRQVNALLVTPPTPVAPGDSLTLVVRYGGVLVGYTETGSLYIKDHVDPEFTILREDAYAFPVLGALSSDANRAAPREPFAFAARVTVPAGQVVAMGGERTGRTERDSLVTWSYRSAQPVPFLNIAIAPYQVSEGAGARIYSFPGDSAGARMVTGAVAGAAGLYTRWYGPLARTSQLVVMEIPDGFGSQASLAAGILQTAGAFRDRAQLGQLYHELSHLWNVRDGDRPSPRWNEGLAMFLQYRVAAELDGWSGWDALLDRMAQRIRRSCAPPARCDDTPLAAYGTAGLTDRSYSVGMLMFYALYQVLGADAFDRAYRGFFQRFRESGATSADLLAAFHAADPRSDAVLADWFTTTRWYARLGAGATIPQIVEGYRRR